MCFSPEADAVVGGIVIVIGVDALRHVRTPNQIPLTQGVTGLIPLMPTATTAADPAAAAARAATGGAASPPVPDAHH